MSENEMVERVARAIVAAVYDAPGQGTYPDEIMSEQVDFHPGHEGQSGYETPAGHYRKISRAAIKAMREPTIRMIDAAGRVPDSDTPDTRQWRSMIDAAFSPPNPDGD